jgi:phage terminase large subunit-like protein
VSEISPEEAEPEPESLDPAGSAWDRCEWLRELREIPGDATWPRLMTDPHPNAAGSFGPEFESWVSDRFGHSLLWWQRLVAARVLEHDSDGVLVWASWLVSTARQVGKSWLLWFLASWRVEQAPRFGEPQTVLHLAMNLAAARKVQEPAVSWARRHEGWKGFQSNGRDEVRAPDGSRWLVRSTGAPYGYSVSLGLVDEAWDVDPKVVDDGLEPTMLARVQPQLGMLSTAHRAATGLFPARRAAALGQVRVPQDCLLVEWSARRDAEPSDRAGWRLASPLWTPLRERSIAALLERAESGFSDDPLESPMESFRSQRLNIWPVAAGSRPGRDEPLVDEAGWAGAADLTVSAAGPLIGAVEDRTGLGAAAAAAGLLPDGRVLVWGGLFPSRAQALGWISLLAPSRLLVGASLAGDEAMAELKVPVEKAGQAETSSALPKLRELLAAGRLVHDGGSQLAEQVRSLRVVERGGGLSVSSRGRSDLARCAAWAVHAAASAPPAKPRWAVF